MRRPRCRCWSEPSDSIRTATSARIGARCSGRSAEGSRARGLEPRAARRSRQRRREGRREARGRTAAAESRRGYVGLRRRGSRGALLRAAFWPRCCSPAARRTLRAATPRPPCPGIAPLHSCLAPHHFTLDGRLAATHGHEGLSAGVHWEQRGADAHLSLSGPLGLGGARLQLHGSTLCVQLAMAASSRGTRPTGSWCSSWGLIRRWRACAYWVVGAPDPTRPGRGVVAR